MHGFRLTTAQRHELRTVLHDRCDAPRYRRALALLALDEGRPVTEVAELLGVSRQTVHNWADAFRRRPAPTSLDDHYGGRPTLWDDDLAALLRAALRRPPQDFGYPASHWPAPRDCACPRTRSAGSCTGWATSGSATATSCPPTRSARKKRAIRRRIGRLQRRLSRLVVLAEDETDLRLFPPLRAGWARRGRPAPVPISGANAKRVLLGTINVATGHRLFLVRRRQRGEDFRALLEPARERYASWDLAVLLDEDSTHTAAASVGLAAELDIELLWLPKRSPHLNPMDHLWRHGKGVVSANRQYRSIDAHVEAFIGYLAGLPDREAMRKAGILSDDFWLDM